MSLYRGAGGASDATDDSTVNAVAGYATDAAASASSAATSATNASNSATAAASSASSAATSASSVATNATNAATSAGLANTYAAAASSSKDAAAASATTASTKAGEASSSASNAASSASTASTQATNAASSASAAATSASAASTSASNAASSASSALAIYGNTTAMNNAVASAATSASNAATSASEANDSRILAEAAVTGASSYASAAQASANDSQAYAGTSEAFKDSALAAASDANISATNAATSEANAAASAASAAAITGSGNGTFVNTPITTDSTVTLSSGNANGVTYLDGSKVLTTGSGLVFDGTNLGVGTTPSAWSSSVRALETVTGAFYSYASGGSGNFSMLSNAYLNSGGLPTYKQSFAAAAQYLHTAGQHQWYTAPSGTAGNAITFTQAMTLDASGRLGVGTSSPGARLDVNGGNANTEVRFNHADNVAGRTVTLRMASTSNATYTGAGAYIQAIQGSGVDVYSLAFGTTQASTTASERMRLDSSGNLGLGVTPQAWRSGDRVFELAGANTAHFVAYVNGLSSGTNYYVNSGGALTYAYTGQNATRYQQTTGGQHQWFTAPSGTAGTAVTFTQAMTLDANGNWGIGTTSTSGARANILATAVAVSAGTTNGAYLFREFGGSAANNIIELNIRPNSGKSGYVTFTESGVADRWSVGIANGDNGLRFISGTPTTGTERMRLDSSGRLLLGTTSFTYSDSNSVMLNNTAGNGYFQHLTGTASGQTYVEFIYAATKIGSISQSGTTAVLYNTTSDQRLKENIQDAESASSLIDALQVRQFDWKADGSHQRYGFVAQELVTVAPEAVHQPADAEDMMAVDYSKLVPMLVKEIQSLRARVAALESTH